MSIRTLREQFPVVERAVYLNAGTDGPLARAAITAAQAELKRQLTDGRSVAHFERRNELSDSLRRAYCSVLGCEVSELALTSCTTEGLGLVVDGMDLGPGDEILTSDEEHPGLLGMLIAARETNGVAIRQVPLAELQDSCQPNTRLIACSHVGWMSGSVAPAELAQLDVPVLLDGAQGAGAIPVDVHALGCDAYAGAGQKWLCGPDGTGMLYVSGRLLERLKVRRRGYANLTDPNEGLGATLHQDARRFDSLSLNAETLACALAAFEVLQSASFEQVHSSAMLLADSLSRRLPEHGREVAPRANTTLVSFSSSDPAGERSRLTDAGIVLRDIPGRPWLRASVGAWNSERDIERLLAAL